MGLQVEMVLCNVVLDFILFQQGCEIRQYFGEKREEPREGNGALCSRVKTSRESTNYPLGVVQKTFQARSPFNLE